MRGLFRLVNAGARATKIAAKLSWARRELGHPLCSCCCSCSCISSCCYCSSVLRLLKIVALFSNSNSSSSWRTVQGANLSPPTSNVARLHKLISNLQRQQQQLQCASVMCREGGRGREWGRQDSAPFWLAAREIQNTL